MSEAAFEGEKRMEFRLQPGSPVLRSRKPGQSLNSVRFGPELEAKVFNFESADFENQPFPDPTARQSY